MKSNNSSNGGKDIESSRYQNGIKGPALPPRFDNNNIPKPRPKIRITPPDFVDSLNSGPYMTPITESEEENVYEAIVDEEGCTKSRVGSKKQRNGYATYDNNKNSDVAVKENGNTGHVYVEPETLRDDGGYVDVIRT